jgi:hypothetical protein|eukprot:Transcript_13066.p1 GENE.Transcript_13066~~Transcript_13066.p1  ORF type:complete len:332 (-),score=110.17 Transcript_13066:1173-2102(-)
MGGGGPKISYAFYHPDGGGRDSFIHASSMQQNVNFSYVPKAPEMPGNVQPGMASGLPMSYLEQEVEHETAQVVGYTGHFPGDRYSIGQTFQHSSQELMETFRAHQKTGWPDMPPAFPDTYPRPEPQKSAEYDNSRKLQEQREKMPGHRPPGYAGHSSGHHHIAGFTYGAIAAKEGTPDVSGAVIGEGAPGLGRISGLAVVQPNLQKGAAPETSEKYTKAGYSGHVPGRHHSSNFGKIFSYQAKELLAAHGQPLAGGVGDPGTEFNADVTAKLSYPGGHVGRPARCIAYISGYKGFRPQATPFETIPGAM